MSRGGVAQVVEQRTHKPRAGGSKPSTATILQNKMRLFGEVLRRDERPITPYFQMVWAFLTSFPLHSPSGEFDLFRGLLFSVREVSV